MDMEDVACTQKEIELFARLRVRYSKLSLALQAYLLRTYQDIEPLVLNQNSIRICKGIYLEERSQLQSVRGHTGFHVVALSLMNTKANTLRSLSP